jgi:hypothetical protein
MPYTGSDLRRDPTIQPSRRQDPGIRIQEAGCRRQDPGIMIQESGSRRQDAGGMRWHDPGLGSEAKPS